MFKTEYEEITKSKATRTRNIVISKCSRGGFTLAQQLETIEQNGIITNVFLKGAFHIEDLNGLYNLRDALSLAIKVVEDESKNDDSFWD